MYISGKVIMVTGGAAGIGLCIVKELLRNNAKVCIADLNQQNGNETLKQLEKEFGSERCIFRKVDVTNKDEFEAGMKATVDHFGHFDVLINNAGLLDDSIWEKEVDVNLKGTINGCILAMEKYLPKYRSSPKAVIVNISSNLGIERAAELPVYGATKCAVIALGKSLSADVNYTGKKVDIVTICPGPTQTGLLGGFVKKGINERYNEMLMRFLNSRAGNPQKPEDVAKNLIDILNNCKNGEFWEIENGERREFIVRDRPEYKTIF